MSSSPQGRIEKNLLMSLSQDFLQRKAFLSCAKSSVGNLSIQSKVWEGGKT